MNQEYLFIGGPADGKRFDVPSDQTHQYIASHPPIKFPSVHDACDPVDIEALSITETLYRKVRLGNPEAPCVFVEKSIDLNSVTKMLIDGYQPQKTRQIAHRPGSPRPARLSAL